MRQQTSNSFLQAVAGRFQTANTEQLEANCQPTEEEGVKLMQSDSCETLIKSFGEMSGEPGLEFFETLCKETECLKLLVGAFTDAMNSQKCKDYIASNQSTAAEVQAFKDEQKTGIQMFGIICATRADGKTCVKVAETLFDDSKSDADICPPCTGAAATLTDVEAGCCKLSCMGCCYHTIQGFANDPELAKFAEICGLESGKPCPNPFDSTTRYVTVDVSVENSVSSTEIADIRKEVAEDLGLDKEDVYVTVVNNEIKITIITDDEDAADVEKKVDSSEELKTNLGGQKVTATPTTTTVKPSTGATGKVIATPLVAALVGLLAFYL